MTLYLITSTVCSVIGGAFSMMRSVAGATGNVVSAVAPQVALAAKEKAEQSGIGWDDIQREAQTLLQQTGKPGLQPEKIKGQARNALGDATGAGKAAGNKASASNEELSTVLKRLLERGKSGATQINRDAVISVMMARSDMSREEAAKT